MLVHFNLPHATTHRLKRYAITYHNSNTVSTPQPVKKICSIINRSPQGSTEYTHIHSRYFIPQKVISKRERF